MKDILDILVSDRQLSPEEIDSVRKTIEEDPGLRDSLAKWIRVEDGAAAGMDSLLPDRKVLVLSVMDRSGIELSPSERELLQRESDGLGRFRGDTSAATLIESRIGDEIDAFNEIWDAHSESRGRQKDRPAIIRQSTSRSRWLWRIPVAATLVFFIALAILLARRDAAFEEIATGPDETRLVELAGGTLIHLRENSRLSYVPQDSRTFFHNRTRLQGRALFEVAPTQAGFIVETPAANVTVIGTVFALDSDDAATDLYVVEGRVTFAPEANPRESVMLDAGHHSRVERGEPPSQPQVVDLAAVLDWTGFFVFRSTAMPDIAIRLGRHYDVQIEVDDALRAETVTGTFDAAQPVETILQTVAAAINASVEEMPSGFRIAAR